MQRSGCHPEQSEGSRTTTDRAKATDFDLVERVKAHDSVQEVAQVRPQSQTGARLLHDRRHLAPWRNSSAVYDDALRFERTPIYLRMV
jgi:hypothetical protein